MGHLVEGCGNELERFRITKIGNRKILETNMIHVLSSREQLEKLDYVCVPSGNVPSQLLYNRGSAPGNTNTRRALTR